MRSFFFHFILFGTFFNVPIKKARIFDGFGVCMHLFFMCKMSPIWICCYFDDSIFFLYFHSFFPWCQLIFVLFCSFWGHFYRPNEEGMNVWCVVCMHLFLLCKMNLIWILPCHYCIFRWKYHYYFNVSVDVWWRSKDQMCL